ncbi:Gfo/Idh/MocA family protein [Falsirhodobacter deserti]|uniref:Gfo/Idh/MocA family protein n=1 Tax=Falsirhodobacter deserti TaxID=1365611 RepID=UPI000FE33AF3|nr:Gfo/Idh/MocA family oxidoreductase [Falsirhodobacter deserti]
MIRWGILSTAKIGMTRVIPAIQAAKGCRVDAIASRDGIRAAQAAEKLGISRHHASYEALLADPAIDAVYNPLPNHLHVPLTLQALSAGKHVLCEKPLALTAEDAAKIVKAQAETGLVVAEAFMTRYHPQWLRAREIVRSGEIGELRAIHVLFSYFNNDPANVRNLPEIGGGGVWDIGCYAMNAARWFFDAEPERVASVIDRDPSFKTDRLTSGLAAFPEGRQLSFTVSTQAARAQDMVLLGQRGRIIFDIPFNCPPDHAAQLVIDSGRGHHGEGRRVEAVPAADQYRLQAEAFVRAISGEALATPIDDAVGNAAALSALLRAGESGSWVKP